MSEESLQIAEKRREAKGNGEKESYILLNAKVQRIARRDKKAVLSDQCKEIEENNRMGKTRDLFKKIRDTKGTFHAKMGTIKDRNCMDLTEAEDIKKRWQENIRSVAQSCPTLRPHEWQHARPPCPSPTPRVHSKRTSIESVMPSSHRILCRPLLLLPPIPPSIRVFSNESTLRMRWPKYWSFSFSIIPSNEHPDFSDP